MTRTFNFSVANNPWMIGFDDVFERLNRIQTVQDSGNYPPYNIIKHDATNFRIELAVAGFKNDELDVELAEGVLSITGKVTNEESTETKYVYRGLAKRTFSRKFTLADDVVVNAVSLTDGILAIDLERIIPDEKKPKKFDIV